MVTSLDHAAQYLCKLFRETFPQHKDHFKPTAPAASKSGTKRKASKSDLRCSRWRCCRILSVALQDGGAHDPSHTHSLRVAAGQGQSGASVLVAANARPLRNRRPRKPRLPRPPRRAGRKRRLQSNRFRLLELAPAPMPALFAAAVEGG